MLGHPKSQISIPQIEDLIEDCVKISRPFFFKAQFFFSFSFRDINCQKTLRSDLGREGLD